VGSSTSSACTSSSSSCSGQTSISSKNEVHEGTWVSLNKLE
jgi:hypothetical protein